MQSFLSKRQWMTKHNSVNPTLPKDGRPTLKDDSFSTKPCPATTSIKSLIPSLSTFNLPPATATTATTTIATSSYSTNLNTDLYSPCSTTTTSTFPHSHDAENVKPAAAYEIPPPIFACNQHIPYPTTTDHYGSPELQQHEIQPVRLLMERLEAWQNVIKCLYNHFEALALVESSIVKSYSKLEDLLAFEHYGQRGADSQQHYAIVNSEGDNSNKGLHRPNSVRSRNSNSTKKKLGRPISTTLSPSTLQSHFAKTGGIREVCGSWQMYHLKNVKDRTDYASFIRTQGLPLLANIKNELKYIIASVRSDDRLSLTHLAKLKEEAAKRLNRLDQQLTFFDHHPDHGNTKEDPWLINTRVIKQMLKVHQQENKMHETVIRLQREIRALEKQLMEDLRQFFQQLYTLRESSWLGVDRGLQEIMRVFDTVTNDADWIAFTEQCKDQLVAEDASYRHPDKLQYPNHNHPLVQPLFAARMERKSSILHKWHEYIYVLTPAGFLHEYRNPKTYPSHPTTTVYAPEYNIITLASNRHHDLVFQLQPYGLTPNFPRLTSSNSISGQHGTTSRSGRYFSCTSSPRKNITLRAKCAQDMQTWLENLIVCSHRYRPMAQCHRSVVDLISSAGTFSPTLVNQEMTSSPRWLVSPAPTHRANISNNMIALCGTPPSKIEEPTIASITSATATTSSCLDLHQKPAVSSTGGFSVLADFLSFATKQLASDHQDSQNPAVSPSTTEQPVSVKSAPDDTSTTAIRVKSSLDEKQATSDQIEPPPPPPTEDSRQSILTGVKYPSATI